MIFGPDKLKADIERDFSIRGITTATIEIGEWQTERHSGATYVVIGLGRGNVRDPAGMRHSGRLIDAGGGQVARPLLARDQTFSIWIHATAPDVTPPELVALESRSATAVLLDQVSAAIRRTRGGLASTPWSVEWIGESRGDFVYGSLVKLDVTISVLVADDARPMVMATEAEVTAQATAPDGSSLPSTPETSTES